MEDLKEKLQNLQQDFKNLDNQPMLPGSEVGGPDYVGPDYTPMSEEAPVVGGPDYVAPDYQPEETVEFSPDPTYQPEEAELSPMPEEVELSPMPEEAELSPMPEETQPTGGTWQLQTESGSGGRMYGVFGTPTAEDVGDKLKTIMATEMVSIGDAIGRLLEGFEEGYRQNEGAEVGRGSPTTKMRLMMDDLSNMRSSATGALRPDEVFAVINKHLSGTAGLGTTTATTNGTATIGTEGYISPDYQAHQQQMVDDLIMMADSSGEYDDNAMIAQFNKTDIRRLIGAARGASPPFNLTARQKVALQKMVSQPWFQAAVGQQGGNI